MDMLSNCLWMIVFHNYYYMQLFFYQDPIIFVGQVADENIGHVFVGSTG
jgi:hypothetical protein